MTRPAREPYYSDSHVTLWHGRCEDVLPTLAAADVSLVLTDPPYGIGERTDRRSKGRSNAAASYDFEPVCGDDEPFNPTHLLRFPRLVLFGANHYAQELPPSPSWIVWDKRAGGTPDDNADCELAWTNIGGPARLYTHLWRGMIKASERDERRTHPTQKPVALMARIIEAYTQPGDLVLDPYAGSGSVLLAAKMLGRRAVGCEIELRYCEVAAQRLCQGVFDLQVTP